jgi:hypothetical protein
MGSFLLFYKNFVIIIIENKNQRRKSMSPDTFIKRIEEYLDQNEIDLESANSDDIGYDNYRFLEIGDGSFSFWYGATRGCFIPYDESDYVLKFDFDGLEEVYCDREVEIYKKACEKGLGACFTKIEPYDYICNVQVYKEEYVPETSAREYTIDKEDLEVIKRRTSKHPGAPGIPPTWVKDFIDYFGMAMYEDFLDFIISYGINDLHFCNLGYIDDRPVVFDYAGFYEPSY